jgi:anti-sigma regulatory factor (Ser/Thr protein kinase)
MAAPPEKSLDQAEDVRTVSIAVPARADAVQVVRTVVGSIASRMGFPYDQVDDLRLATSEVVAHLLEEQPPPDHLIVKVMQRDGAIEVEASRTSPTKNWPPSGARHSLTTLILRALADEASFDRSEHGPAIRFTKRFESGSAPVS